MANGEGDGGAGDCSGAVKVGDAAANGLIGKAAGAAAGSEGAAIWNGEAGGGGGIDEALAKGEGGRPPGIGGAANSPEGCDSRAFAINPGSFDAGRATWRGSWGEIGV